MNIRVVNISFGATTFGEKENLVALEKAIEKLWDNNIIVVAAAGNEGPGRQTVAIPGTCKKLSQSVPRMAKISIQEEVQPVNV